MRIGKLKFGLLRATHDERGPTKPYVKMLCTILAYPVYYSGKALVSLAVLMSDWSLSEAISTWKDV